MQTRPWIPDPRSACVLAFAAALALGTPQAARAAADGVADFTITATASAGGTIDPAGTVLVVPGSDVTFNIVASACDTILDVQVDGVSVGRVTSYTFTNVTANHTIDATFGILSFTVTPSAGNGGAITPAEPVSLPCGSDLKLDFTPASCYRVEDVLVDGVSVGAVSTYAITGIAADHTVAASFTLKTFSIDASAGPGGDISSAGHNELSCGSGLTFTVTPEVCYSISDILVDGVSVGTGPTYTFSDLQADHTISASFTIDQFTIAASSGSGGTIDPAGDISVNCGGSQQFTITPDDCYSIADVLVDGVSVGKVTQYPISGVQANHTIAASFSLDTYEITSSATPGGTIGPLGLATVTCGADQAFAITPDPCYSLVGLSVDGLPVTVSSSYTFTNVRADHTIAATFAGGFDMYSVAGAGGTISPSGNLHANCHDDQSYTIAPDACHAVGDVLVDGISVGAVTSYTFTDITVAHTIEAQFAVLTDTIAVTQSAGGTISPGGDVVVNCGSDQAFTITPDACHTLVEVIADGVPEGPVPTYTFSTVAANHTLTATYAIKTFTVTASAGAGGTIAPTGANVVDCGADRAFTIAAEACHHVADVLADGVSVGAVTDYTFHDVTSDHTIAASFALDTFTLTATSDAGAAIAPSGPVTVDCGTDLTFHFTADSCHTIQDVSVDGAGVALDSTYTFTNVQASHTLHLTVAVKSYAIAAGAGTGGSITPSGPVAVTCGDNQSFTIAADACYSIADVLVDGVSVGAVASYPFDNVTSDHTITATFASSTLATSTALSALPHPSACPDTIRLNADVTPGSATGSVEFFDGATPLGSAPVAAGQAVLFTGALAVGAHTLSAVFTPSGCFLASTSPDYAHSVTQGASSVALDADVEPAIVGHSVTFAATVTPSSATGTVTFRDSLTTLGTIALTAGTAHLTTAALAVGTHTQITATYNSDACFASSISPPWTQHVDPDPAPAVAVTQPNGGESWELGDHVAVTWTATDNGSIASVRIELSRDNGGTWETLAASVPNSGTFDWTVSAPGTNSGSDTTHVYSALVRVTATDDLAQDGADASDSPFALFDVTTAVVITQLDAETIDDGVSIKWAFVNRGLFASLELQRSPSDVGPWTALDADVRDDAGVTVAVDRTAQAGQSYFYRLVGTTRAGAQSVFGPVKGTAGAPKAFALSAVWPNPSRGPLTLQFSMPRTARVRLSVLDLQGREVAVLADGEQQPGRYEVRWDGQADHGPVPAGLYFVRFVTPDRKLVSRVAIAR